MVESFQWHDIDKTETFQMSDKRKKYEKRTSLKDIW